MACDLDPRNFKINGQPVFRFIGGLPEPIQEILSMAKGSIGAGGVLKPVFLSRVLEESEVTLTNFSKWAESIGLDIPEAFPGKSVSKQTSQEETALGERERATLLTLIAALAQEAGIDISKPSKAAGLIEGLTMRLNTRVGYTGILELEGNPVIYVVADVFFVSEHFVDGGPCPLATEVRAYCLEIEACGNLGFSQGEGEGRYQQFGLNNITSSLCNQPKKAQRARQDADFDNPHGFICNFLSRDG